MDRDDAISVSSGDRDQQGHNERRALLEAPIRSVVDALGGIEGGSYRLGDECYGCLKDLKKFWRKDDTDDERTVARIFWETRVLPNDLIPILMETAGNGHFEDKRAIACADLMTAMTWPIDLAEELRELDEEQDKGTDYTQLLLSHLNYKAALLKPGVMQALFGVMVACLAKDAKEKTEKDTQVISVILYLIRNLAFIKDLPSNMHLSSDQAEYSSLQTRLVKALSDTHILDFLLTTASSAPTDPMCNGFNTLVLEIFYLVFRGVKPAYLAVDQAKQPTQTLQRLLAVEDQRRREHSKNAATRHSRFGTTISVMLNPKKLKNIPKDSEQDADVDAPPESSSTKAFVLHRQQAIHREAGTILDMASAKRQKTRKGKKIDELAREDNLSLEAKLTLQDLARQFIESCFNPFLSSLLKDIKAERPKITEKDNLRLLFITKWFLEFFLCQRASDKERIWAFGLIAEVTERGWIVWVLKRMREAVEEKPKLWTELQAGVECLTQLVLLLDAMSSSNETEVADGAQALQQQIIYNGEVLDIALDSMRSYKEGTQSLTYLDSSIHLAYALLRMLEKCEKQRSGGETYVRKKAKKKKRGKRGDDTSVPDVEDVEQSEEEEEITETMFTFDAFEQKFAHPDITQTLLVYLARHKEFSSSENMKRVVNLIHRQAVKAKAEGLFFKVSTLDLFKSILFEEKSLPRDQPHKDLLAVLNYIIRKFFKALEEDSFLMIEAFFPKNRGNWKQFSSWEPEDKSVKNETVLDTRFPPDVKVKKGYSWSEQLGIAIACLVDDGKAQLIDWVKQVIIQVIGQRQRIIEDIDGSCSKGAEQSDDDNQNIEDDTLEAASKLRGPSEEALAQLKDYLIPYITDEQADAVTKDPYLKLLFRLLNFAVLSEDAEELEWYVPKNIVPAELQRSLNVINQFLESPLDLGGKKAAQLLNKKPRRRRRIRSPTPSGDEKGSDDEPRKKKKEKKKKEELQYKSAQFIEDSDAEYGDMEAFFEKEKALREKTSLAAASTGKIATMKPTGTKKRRKTGTKGQGKRKRKRGLDGDSDIMKSAGGESDADERLSNPAASLEQSEIEEVEETRPKPRPRPRPLNRATQPGSQEPSPSNPAPGSPSGLVRSTPKAPPISLTLSSDDESSGHREKFLANKKKVLVISDDEDD